MSNLSKRQLEWLAIRARTTKTGKPSTNDLIWAQANESLGNDLPAEGDWQLGVKTPLHTERRALTEPQNPQEADQD